MALSIVLQPGATLVSCGGKRLIASDDYEKVGHDGASKGNGLCLQPEDAATQFRIQGVRFKGLFTLPSEFFRGIDAKKIGSAADASSIEALTLGSKWRGDFTVDGDPFECSAEVVRQGVDGFDLRVQLDNEFDAIWSFVAKGTTFEWQAQEVRRKPPDRRQATWHELTGEARMSKDHKVLSMTGSWRIRRPGLGLEAFEKVGFKLKLQG